jgi:hypothetical protein
MLYCKWIANRVPLRRLAIAALVMFLITPLAGRGVHGEIGTMDEARQVCQNWLKYMISQRGAWAGDVSPEIIGSYEIMENDTVLGYYFTISPSGYIVVPVLKELPPIKAYSEKYSLDIEETQGILSLLKNVLHSRIRLYTKTYGSLDAVQPSTGDVLLGRGHKVAWKKFLKSAKGFEADLMRGVLPSLTEAGPLLTTSWYQGSPYNNLCPMGDGGRCIVGCVATAASQIMKYWHWPPYGDGSRSYEWDGDDSCDSTHSVGAGTQLDATFWDLYDWRNMPDSCDLGCTPEQEDALAELCYEVGIAFKMDYGVCGSGPYENTGYAVTVYPTYFRYSSEINRRTRTDYSAAEWFDIIQNEINSLRPMQYHISGHSIVCDGWRIAAAQNQYHMNYGWGNARSTWYSIDSLYCSWEPDSLCPISKDYLIRQIKPDNQICGTIYDSDGGPLTETGGPYYVRCHLEIPSKQQLTIEQSVWLVFRAGKKLVAWGPATASGNNIHFESPNCYIDLNTTLRLKNGGYLKLP